MSKTEIKFEAIGTTWIIDLYDLPEELSQDQITRKILERIEQYDVTYSRFRPDSLVTRIAKNKSANNKYTLPDDSRELFDIYQKLYLATDGKLTPLIGNLLVSAGYDEKYSLITSETPLVEPPSWNDSINLEGNVLEAKLPALLDFGAAGKGHLVDLVAELLTQMGIRHFCVDAGGDILCKTKKDLIIGLENPQNPREVVGAIKLNNKSLCASSGNRRKWGKFHHIIDAKTLSSPNQILATWVIAQNAIVADGVATGLFLAKPRKLLDYFDFEYAVLYDDFSLDKSHHFAADFFINDKYANYAW